MNAKEAIAALGALAHETRLAVFRMLVERGPNGLPAGAIAERLDMPPSSLTFHLQQLAHAGLVTPAPLEPPAHLRRRFRGDERGSSPISPRIAAAGLRARPACNPAAARQGASPAKGDRHETDARPCRGRRSRGVGALLRDAVRARAERAKPDYAKWMLDDPRINFAISAARRQAPASSISAYRSRTRANWPKSTPGSSAPSGRCWRKRPRRAATRNRTSSGSPIRRASPGRRS